MTWIYRAVIDNALLVRRLSTKMALPEKGDFVSVGLKMPAFPVTRRAFNPFDQSVTLDVDVRHLLPGATPQTRINCLTDAGFELFQLPV